MRKHELPHACSRRDIRGFSCRCVARLERQRRFVVCKRRLVNQEICAFGRSDCRLTRTCVSGEYDAPSRPRRSDKLRRLDNSAVIECHGLAPVKLSPRRTLRYSELARSLGIEAAESDLFNEREAERDLLLVIDCKGNDRISLALDGSAGFDLIDLQWKYLPVAAERDRLPQQRCGA